MHISNVPIIIQTPYNLMELFMKYFSIDYRSPPSGMGQIIDTTQPERTQRPNGQECWNYILVSYGSSEDFWWDSSYIGTKYFESEQAAQEGWAGPVLPQIFQFLRVSKVTHVYDSELSYEEDGADDEGFFTLDRWIEIMRSYL
jgi:hypothetical protein